MVRKWFLAEIGHVGLNNLLAAYTNKSADAICTFAYCEGPGSEVEIFEGICEVYI
jgi:inosine triphosphate pyrophosphatase